jgi:hypothetical protein
MHMVAMDRGIGDQQHGAALGFPNHMTMLRTPGSCSMEAAADAESAGGGLSRANSTAPGAGDVGNLKQKIKELEADVKAKESTITELRTELRIVRDQNMTLTQQAMRVSVWVRVRVWVRFGLGLIV